MAKKNSQTQVLTLTQEELQKIIANAVAQVAGAKVAPKVAKPTTRKQALAQWEAKKGITPENKQAYKALVQERFEADWEVWTSSKAYKALKGAERKAANKAKAKALRASYAKTAGQSK